MFWEFLCFEFLLDGENELFEELLIKEILCEDDD